MLIFEGGNTTVTSNITGKSYSGEKIDLNAVKLPVFRKEFMKLFNTLNDLFYKEYKRKLWKSEDITNAIIFNGSSSYALSSEYPESEILKHKSQIGDIDVTIPDYELKPMFLLLRKNENKRFGKFTYKGSYQQNENAIGDQIITIFKFYYDNENYVNTQIDFEGVDFANGSPTEFARFGHSSSFEDAKENIKALHHKCLIQSIFTTLSIRPDIVIATNSSTPDNIKQASWNKVKPAKGYKFSTTGGLRFCLTPMLDKNGNICKYNGCDVYKEIPTKESKFIRNVSEIFKMAFGGKGNIADFHSFIGICKLIKKHCDIETQKNILENYFVSMFGPSAQQKEKDIDADIALKLPAVNYIENALKLRVQRKEGRIQAYKARRSQ